MLLRLRALLGNELAAPAVLLAATLLALVLANSALGPAVDKALHLQIGGSILGLDLAKTVAHWINDGLMVPFLLLVGMEIKREIAEGALSQPSTVALPIAGAVGGIVVPAAIYVAFTWQDPVAVRGWAIPSATDIAFAVAVLASLGRRVPLGLKLFLLTLAIVDDLAAIVIIAIFYSGALSTTSLVMAALCIAGLVALNLAGVRRLSLYLLLGVVLWLCVLKSGVHATLAGVVLACCLPLKGAAGAAEERPFVRLEHALQPWVGFLVMPVFAFANSGVDLRGITAATLSSPVTLGIVAGLFVGKQLGIFGGAWALIRLGHARLPDGASWSQLYATGICGGIGFTMSLFIGTLAARAADFEAMVRLGVMAGSLLSGVAGYALLRATSPSRA